MFHIHFPAFNLHNNPRVLLLVHFIDEETEAQNIREVLPKVPQPGSGEIPAARRAFPSSPIPNMGNGCRSTAAEQLSPDSEEVPLVLDEKAQGISGNKSTKLNTKNKVTFHLQ